MEAIILAGGLGTRLRSAVSDLPKPLAPIGNKPFLAYLLDFWITQGVNRFVLSVGYKHEAIQNKFGSEYKGVEVDYAVETLPLGTGGGLILSSKKLRSPEPFLILNGDTFFNVNLIDLLKHHLTCEADITLSLIEIPGNKRYNSAVLDDKGFVQSLEKRSKTSKSNWANGGVYVMTLNLLHEYANHYDKNCSLEDELLPDLLKKRRRVAGFISNGDFVDIGSPEDYLRAGEILFRDHGN
jgi:D-glycero-alpha-D-manno-heptose 1-phosphate guanylyltransferase